MLRGERDSTTAPTTRRPSRTGSATNTRTRVPRLSEARGGLGASETRSRSTLTGSPRSTVTPPSGSARITRFTAKRMVRSRGRRRMRSAGAELVARAVHRLDRITPRGAQLGAHAAHVAVDGAVGDHGPRLVGAAHQV